MKVAPLVLSGLWISFWIILPKATISWETRLRITLGENCAVRQGSGAHSRSNFCPCASSGKCPRALPTQEGDHPVPCEVAGVLGLWVISALGITRRYSRERIGTVGSR